MWNKLGEKEYKKPQKILIPKHWSTAKRRYIIVYIIYLHSDTHLIHLQ